MTHRPSERRTPRFVLALTLGVEELTGRDLASARDRIKFWRALRGRELMS